MFNSMFDELKEVKKELYRSNRFQESHNVKYFKEINRLKSPQKAEAYLEPKQASTVEPFTNILKGLLFLLKTSIIDVRLGYI